MDSQADIPLKRWRPLHVLGVCIAVAACLVWGYALAFRVPLKEGAIVDSSQEWIAARNFQEGRPIYGNYRADVEREFELKEDAPLILEVNAHPPTSALLALPLGKFDYPTAHLAINIASLVAFVAAMVFILGQWGLNCGWGFGLATFTLALATAPLWAQCFYGQLNCLLLLLIASIWVSWRHGWVRTAGALIGLAAAVKLFPAFLGIVLLAKRRWDGVAAAAAGFLAAGGVTVYVLGWETYRDYVTIVMPALQQFQSWWTNASLWGFFMKLFDGSRGHVVPLCRCPLIARLLIGAACLAVTAAAYLRNRRAEGMADRDLAFVAAVWGMFLVSPITWDHYFLIAILPLAILWKRLQPTWVNRGTVLAGVVALGLNVAWLANLVIAGSGEHASAFGKTPSVAVPWQTLTVLSFQTYAVVALLLVAMHRPPAGEPGAVCEAEK